MPLVSANVRYSSLRHLRTVLKSAFAILTLLTGWQSHATAENHILRLKWFHSFQFAGYYAAVEQGYYRDAGLDITIEERDPAGTNSPVQAVVNGDISFSISDSSLILERLNGAPVVAVAAIFQTSPLVLLSLEKSGIESALDLAGKRVMFQKNVDDAVIMAMLNEVGLTENEFTHVPHTFSDLALLDGSVDAMSAYISNQPYLYRERDIPVNIINPVNYGIEFYGDILMTSQRLMNKNPEAVLAFRKATIRGWEYALAHPEAILPWFDTRYPTDRYRDNTARYEYEVNQIRRMIKPKLIEIGEISPSRFRRIADIYKEKGLAPKRVSLAGLLYTHYTPKKHFSDWLPLIASATLLLLLIAVGLVLINQRLKHLVAQRTKELEHANLAKDQFLASMSHELRTPLNSIIGFSRRLIKKRVLENDPRSEAALDSIHRSGTHLLNLINDILDIAKIDANHIELQKVDCDIRAIIQECLDDLKPTIDKPLILEAPQHYAYTTVFADATRLKQVIINLLSNAVKYSEEGTISIVLEKQSVDEKPYCVIHVIDNGIGISEKNQKQLFQRFMRFDERTLHKPDKGTGLGLVLVKELMEHHGGFVRCDSELGVGSRFSVFFPETRDA